MYYNARIIYSYSKDRHYTSRITIDAISKCHRDARVQLIIIFYFYIIICLN